MSDLVGNPENLFSQIAAHVFCFRTQSAGSRFLTQHLLILSLEASPLSRQAPQVLATEIINISPGSTLYHPGALCIQVLTEIRTDVTFLA